MVMSGSDERVVFICDRPGDESLFAGGTIARLRSEDARVVLVFGGVAPGVSATVSGSVTATGTGSASDADSAELDAEREAELEAACAELDVSDRRMLSAASVDGTTRRGQVVATVTELLADVQPTALVVVTAAEPLLDAATAAANSLGVPVFLSRRMSDDVGKRLTAIDVSDEVGQKTRAVAAYRSRWSIKDGAVLRPDGVLQAITGTETYLRLEPAAGPAPEARATAVGRLVTAVFALFAGALYGVLGTVAHQATITVAATAIPVGLALALIGAAALLVGLRLLLHDRMAVLLAALGLLGTVFVLSLRSTGGSVLVPAGLTGTLWTVVPALVAALVVAWPKLPAKR
ncbi:PIG-L deacetylase family protein [Glaciibacter sp. 2TAF33]|uniref:PIG-L deacetylase family protein n=1 Tax=Glaciibacter sp. 2TAF33 TaxID=3233015 RepID=UPI003F920628